MRKFDFETIYDRHGKDAIALDALGMPGRPEGPDEGYSPITMWIADMNFATAPSVVKAMEERLKHPLFGYYPIKQEYYDAIIRWHRERKGVEDLLPEHIMYENGVLGGLVTALHVLCSQGDNVLVHTPTYVGFTEALNSNGYHIVHSGLQRDEAGIWRMDFGDMEQKIVDNKIHAAIFCSPHNPTGRVWKPWEIEKAMALFEKYEVKVISDEIWSDIILTGYRHTPTQSVSAYAHKNTVALYAPSKTFNLAGLIGSYSIVYDRVMRERMQKESSLCHYNVMNVLSQYALIGGYSEEGMAWADEMCEVITENVNFALGFIREHFEGVTVSDPQGTYVIFLDCENWCKAHNMGIKELLSKGQHCGVIWQDGTAFGGEYTIRMNLASPMSMIRDAFDRLDRLVFQA